MTDLHALTQDERNLLAVQLLQEQVVEQRKRLHHWRDIANQPAQIDSGYIGQFLVSLVAGLEGGGYRGKGLDLEDGSEVKTANFLDSLDKKGATSPRWNFQSNSVEEMYQLLECPHIYLASLDTNAADKVRARVWRLDPKAHEDFQERYLAWIETYGKPKLAATEGPRQYANFQVFPPRNRSADTWARHGGGNGLDAFPALQIGLEDEPGSVKMFHAEEDAATGLIAVYVAP